MRFFRLLALSAAGVLFAVSAQATNFAGKSENAAAASEKSVKAAAPAKAAKADPSREAKKKKVEEKKKELDGSRWEITRTATDGKGAPESDEITFQDGKVAFRSFGEDGFGASNYTITVPEGSETAIWETMQNSEKGILFVRGEWKDEQMNGIISRQTPDEPEKPAKDYSFTTAKRTAISPVSEPKDAKVSDAPAADQTGESDGNVLSSAEKSAEQII